MNFGQCTEQAQQDEAHAMSAEEYAAKLIDSGADDEDVGVLVDTGFSMSCTSEKNYEDV